MPDAHLTLLWLPVGLMLSEAGDIRCLECALVDNLRTGAELNRMSAPYNTTGTMNNTIIAINTRAMKPFTISRETENEESSTLDKLDRRLSETNASDLLPASGLPHFQRDDPDQGITYGWCVTIFGDAVSFNSSLFHFSMYTHYK
jgi:hypothetical protein